MGAEKAEASLDSLIAGFNSQISELQDLVIARNRIWVFVSGGCRIFGSGRWATEIDDPCEEWVPEPLIPPITEDMQYEPPVLESAAGPHTIVNGKEVVNFVSSGK